MQLPSFNVANLKIVPRHAEDKIRLLQAKNCLPVLIIDQMQAITAILIKASQARAHWLQERYHLRLQSALAIDDVTSTNPKATLSRV